MPSPGITGFTVTPITGASRFVPTNDGSRTVVLTPVGPLRVIDGGSPDSDSAGVYDGGGPSDTGDQVFDGGGP